MCRFPFFSTGSPLHREDAPLASPSWLRHLGGLSWQKAEHLSMKRGRGGKEGVEHCWKRFAIIGNGLQLLGKRHMAAVLGAQTQGETHRQNDASLAVRPKDTNLYPWRDPFRGIPKGERPPKAAAPFVEVARSAASSI